MDKRENIPSSEPLPSASADWDIGRGKSGDSGLFREAKLFLGKDRATLTFFLNDEVASIHYDMARNEIFYRGHNVKNMVMDSTHWLALERFGDYLAQDPRALRMRGTYRLCLEHLMTDYGLPG